MTTVGYGDVSPVQPLGKFIALLAMMTGYAIIAVPMGIVGAEINRQMKELHDKMTEGAEDVGERFPEEARKIHYGETEERETAQRHGRGGGPGWS